MTPYCVHVCFGGPTRKIIVDGEEITFEAHPYCGPAVLNKRGDPAARQPGTRHPFWQAVSLWAQQGERVDDEGRCVWDTEPRPITEQIAGRHHRVVGWTKPERGA